MIKKILITKSLFIILLLAAILRLWHLGSIPPSLTPDEAALGYNAYSILHTARDEYGKFLPLIFKSFGDYKPGAYIYLDIPFVAALGLNELSTRLPSALVGILSVYLIYLIFRKLFGDELRVTGLIAAFVAATNPYLIYFSRGAWEANMSLTLTLAGIYLFLKSFQNSKLLILSSVSFALTLVTYQGAKLSTAIVLIVLLVIYWKDFWKINKGYLLTSGMVGLIIAIPILLSLFNGQTGRLKVFSIFSYHRSAPEIQEYKDSYYSVFHSEGLNYGRAILGRWFNNFSGKYLFFEGDNENPVSTAPYQGVLLMCDLLFLPLGLIFIFKKYSLNPKPYTLVILWLILAPLSASISRDTTNAVRSLNVAVPMVIISSFGIYYIITKLRVTGYGLVFVIWGLGFVYFLDAYFIHVPAHYSQYWRYGYKEMVKYVTENQSKYPRVVVEQSFNQPYIYFLFYNRIITKVNLVGSANVLDVGLVEKLGNIEFKPIDWQVLRNQPGTLVISGSNPEFGSSIKQIKYLDGYHIAFNIVVIK